MFNKWGTEMKDIIYREDAVGVINGWFKLNHLPEFGDGMLHLVPSADRPQGDVDAVDIFEREMHNLEQGYITLGEFDERIEPLRHLCYGRPQGEWIYGEHDVAMCDGYRCDRCGFFVPWDYEHKSIDFINDYNFCPNCGCRMKGADDVLR